MPYGPVWKRWTASTAILFLFQNGDFMALGLLEEQDMNSGEVLALR
jgi:hypothetical protein